MTAFHPKKESNIVMQDFALLMPFDGFSWQFFRLLASLWKNENYSPSC
jgi:hypothetical protein